MIKILNHSINCFQFFKKEIGNSRLSKIDYKIATIACLIFLALTAFVFSFLYLYKKINPFVNKKHPPPISPHNTINQQFDGIINNKKNAIDERSDNKNDIVLDDSDNVSFSLSLFESTNEEQNFPQKNSELVNVEYTIAEFNDKINKGNNVNQLLKDKNVKKALIKYPELFRCYLEKIENKKNNFHLIQSEILKFCSFLEFFHKEHDIIEEGMIQINKLLNNVFFLNGEYIIPEEEKDFAILFFQFFSIVNKNLKILSKQPHLIQSLKIQFANLPIIDSRTQYPKLYLSEKEQLNILIQHFQKIEDESIDLVIENECFKYYLLTSDKHKINILAYVKKNYLSQKNLDKLQKKLRKNNLSNPFQKSIFSSYKNPYIDKLYRASKAKRYFLNQLNLDESKIRIPRWYHSTDHLETILTLPTDTGNHEIKVLKGGKYLGAFVSNQREINYGKQTLAFTNNITEINGKVNIGYQKGKIRWRGLLVPIPLRNKDKPHVAFIGLKDDLNKNKSLKTCIKEYLKNLDIEQMVISYEQLDFMQQVILKAIGCPNLPENWWGKADVKTLKIA